MDREIKSFIKKITKEIREENAAIFAGAGLSISAGFLNWNKLIEPIANELGLEIEKENDLVSLAQYYCNEHGGNRHEISSLILDEFSKESEITENHKILARLPIKNYWTTNYDSLIENALKEEGKVADVKYTIKQLALTKAKRDAVVYKMHGDSEHSSDAILIKDDYETYHMKYAPFITALSGDLVSKTFLFIGFSFTDPNLDYIFSRIRSTYETDQRTHYCFVKKVKEDEFDESSDFEHFKRKQELFINDLKRHGIQALILNDYNEITEILKKIEQNINRKNIFISGSAATFDTFKNNPHEFISSLSGTLIKENYNIISGFGLGVGSLIISGALEELYMKQKKIDNSRLLMRPFPQDTYQGNLKELWTAYREDMISRSGISIFLFGNKVKNDEIIDANGVYSEFEIACKKGNKIIPVGSTHWVARKIWEEVNENFDKFYPKSDKKLKELFFNLNNDNLSIKETINVILKFIKEIEKEG